MQKAYIFCHNPKSYLNDSFLLDIKTSGLIIAIDGGANYLCDKGIVPGVVIGDCDSILPKYLQLLKGKTILKKFPIDKDKSDSELALDYCVKNGYNDITLINAVNGRLAHSLANLFLVEKFVKQGINLYFVNRDNEIFVVDNSIQISTDVGSIISLISLTESTFVEKTEGLKFALSNELLYRSSTRTISNITLQKKCSIKISSGILLVIKERMLKWLK